MILDLRAFEEYPVATALEAANGEFKPFAPDVTAVRGVRLNLTIQKTGSEYFCRGEVTATYTVECARCLAEFQQKISQPTEFIACGTDQPAARGGKTPDDEDYVFFHSGDLCADVGEPVRQALILSLPMKPLCSKDCRGLCPTCGLNLNEQTCNCIKDTVDPRWEGLRGLANSDQG